MRVARTIGLALGVQTCSKYAAESIRYVFRNHAEGTLLAIISLAHQPCIPESNMRIGPTSAEFQHFVVADGPI
jgi:hypothetical protein